jgi:dipeptidyl aminopeptidase/acylaminoacyl peptidase
MPVFPERMLRPGDLFALRYVHEARLSPAGDRVAYVTSRTPSVEAEEVLEITIERSDSGMPVEVDFAGHARFPRWSPDGSRLAFTGMQAGSSRLYVADAQGCNVRALTAEGVTVQGPPSWSADGAALVCSAMTRPTPRPFRRITRRVFRAEGLGDIEGLRLDIHLIDVVRGTSRALDIGGRVALQSSFSPCGRWILFLGSSSSVGYPPLDLRPFILDLQDGTVRQVLDGNWYITRAAWSPCGERIVFAGDRDSHLTLPVSGLWVVGRDGSNPQCRTTGLTGNVGLLVHHDMPTWGTSQENAFCVADADTAYTTVMQRGCAHIYRIALSGAIRCEPVVSGDRTCLIMDASPRGLLYCVTDLHSPWELYRADLHGRDECAVTCLNAHVLRDWPRFKVEHLAFESEDGTALEGWHFARADRDSPQPTVLFIHGGPELATGHAFRFDFVLLAANGYSVMLANFRGSSGYGKAFRAALHGDWGSRGFPDHMAAADACVQRGLADTSRLGVWGPSHGGFATAWIVGHTRRFRAAVAESSVTNLATLYSLTDAPDLFIQELGGRPDEIPDSYRARSPLTYAARCRTPTLMLHGEDDLRCSIVEAEQFYRALHDAGCMTELVSIPRMTHMGDSVGPLTARLAQNEALLDWFERFL